MGADGNWEAKGAVTYDARGWLPGNCEYLFRSIYACIPEIPTSLRSMIHRTFYPQVLVQGISPERSSLPFTDEGDGPAVLIFRPLPLVPRLQGSHLPPRVKAAASVS